MCLALAVSCSEGDGRGALEEPPLRCQHEASDGCLTVRAMRTPAPRTSHFHLASSEGDPVRQYLLAPTLDLGRGSITTRPLEPGAYVLYVFRGREPRKGDVKLGSADCRRAFEIRTARRSAFRVLWRPGACDIEPVGY